MSGSCRFKGAHIGRICSHLAIDFLSPWWKMIGFAEVIPRPLSGETFALVKQGADCTG